MKHATGLVMLLATLILSGCKATLETELTVLDLLYGKTKMLAADFHSAVGDCEESSTTAPAAGTLRHRQALIAALFPDAEYQGCTAKAGQHFAHFRIPIALDKDRDGELASNDHINLISSEDAFLMIAIPAALRDRIEEAVGQDLHARDLPFEAKIRIRNDHGNALPFQVFSLYVDDRPFLFGDVTLPKAQTVTLRLSDVTVDNAIERGSAILMMKSEESK